MNYDDFTEIGWRSMIRKANGALCSATDSYANAMNKRRKIPVTKEVKGEGALDVADALERAAVDKLKLLSPIVR